MSVRDRIIDECIAKALDKIKQRGMDRGNLDYGLLDAIRQSLGNLKLQSSKISDVEIHDTLHIFETSKRNWDGPFLAMEDALNSVINGKVKGF